MSIKKKNYLTCMYSGNTLLDIYGDSYDVEDVYDICIANTEISVWEMIHELNWGSIKAELDEALYLARVA
jgi:hypothetical protein